MVTVAKNSNFQTSMIAPRLPDLHWIIRRGWIFDHGYTFEPRFPIS